MQLNFFITPLIQNNILKNLFLLSFLVSINFFAIGQNKLSESDIVGTWKITAIDMGGIYMNLQNDSTHIPDSLKKNWKSNEDSAIAIGMLKMVSGTMKLMVITIQTRGVFEAHMGPKGESGTYVITGDKVVLTLNGKGDPLVGILENDLLKFDSGEGKNRLVMYFQKKFFDQ